MLLLHQAGSVKVGEVVRYTVTYTPSADRIVPPPKQLHVRIKNTSGIALRAAYLHGPYTIHVAAYPSSFSPNKKFETLERDGAPQFEPNLKAGNHWNAQLTIPQDVRETSNSFDQNVKPSASQKCVSWVIEVASQVLFSNTASVSYEILVGRDERSLDLGFASVASKGHGGPGELAHAIQVTNQPNPKEEQLKGVYSRAISLLVEDTATLWKKPALPSIDDPLPDEVEIDSPGEKKGTKKQRQKKIHLVILTHGLHSNLGADMLYMKESIDEAAAEAAQSRAARKKSKQSTDSSAHGADTDEEEEDDEEVVVRGFPGNAVRTERGIQYLGKRLANFILTLTYPHQPYLPPSKSMSRSLTGNLSLQSGRLTFGRNSVPKDEDLNASRSRLDPEKLPYKFTSISFVGHSLGGNIQTYAIAYIQKHSPEFFEIIKPVNFIAMASPLLGLNNENPMYVKFALDFGLVGRTGRDLGLAWKGPNIRSGWTAMISGFGGGGNNQPDKSQGEDPRSKPLLRILPTGPAHHVLRKFRNRTVYANVVNDGIVPLRTSCLLFLDWRSLDRVENAQREAGVLTRVAAFGWNELMGAPTTSSHRPKSMSGVSQAESSPGDSDLDYGPTDVAPNSGSVQKQLSLNTQTSTSAGSTLGLSPSSAEPAPHQFLNSQNAVSSPQAISPNSPSAASEQTQSTEKTSGEVVNPFSQFFNFFRGEPPKPPPETTRRKSSKVSRKTTEKFKRAQTIRGTDSDGKLTKTNSKEQKNRPRATRGDSLDNDPSGVPPPKTSIFEAATDIIDPPMPDDAWLLDPSTRARSIFHDRVYHPSDIPPPSVKKPKLGRSFSNGSLQSDVTAGSRDSEDNTSGMGMKVEEKIARAYHKDLSWRKVLVRLEPDAHNNIIVRRMFANAYGWDVIKHLCDSHFSDTYTSNTKDSREPSTDRVGNPAISVTEEGEEVQGQTERKGPKRTDSELREATDEVKDLGEGRGSIANASATTNRLRRKASEDSWDEHIFEGSDDDGDSDDEPRSPFDKFHSFWSDGRKPRRRHSIQHQNRKGSRKQSDSVAPESVSAEIREAMRTPAPAMNTSSVVPLSAEAARPGAIVKDNDEPIDTSSVGLQKSVAEQVQPPEPAMLKRTSSLTEQVAKLTLTKSGGQPSEVDDAPSPN